MAQGSGLLTRISDFIRGPREPSAKELAARGLANEGIDPDKAFGQFETDLTLQYLTTVGADFSPSDIRNLLIRARWGDPRWIYSIYDLMPRLGPGPQMRKMIEAIRSTEDQYKTTPDDADIDAEPEEGQKPEFSKEQLATAIEARDYVEAALTPWVSDIKAHMARAELYGIAAGEIVTDPRGLMWRGTWKERIVDFRPIAERRFRIDPGSHEWLLLLQPLSMEGVPILPLIQRGKLLWYELGAGLEQLDQRGLCFQLLLPWAIQNYCVRWRAKRVEKYGVPPAIGKVPLQDAKQKAAMQKALQDFAASMFMVIGEKESVEFANALAQGRIDPQAEQIEWCSRQFDMILLGDTQASQVQVGAGSKQSKEQAIGGFHDLTNSRVLRLNAAVFNRQLIPGLIFRNFGADIAAMNCPTIESSVSESDDAAALSTAALNISNAGFAAKIDGEDLVRRCTLQVASEDDQEEAKAAEQAKTDAAAKAKEQQARSGGPLAAPAEREETPPATGRTAAGPKLRLVKEGKRFMASGDFQAPAHEPVVFPAPTLASPRIRLVSYGHENGPLDEADSIVDARGLGYSEEEGYGDVDPARTGRDPTVQSMIRGGDKAGPTYGGLKSATLRAIRSGEAAGKRELMVGVACDHGRHRSVYVAERLGHELRQAGHDVTVEHRDADKYPLHGQGGELFYSEDQPRDDKGEWTSEGGGGKDALVKQAQAAGKADTSAKHAEAAAFHRGREAENWNKSDTAWRAGEKTKAAAYEAAGRGHGYAASLHETARQLLDNPKIHSDTAAKKSAAARAFSKRVQQEHGYYSIEAFAAESPERPKRTREAQQKIAEKVRAHLKVLHKKALEEGEKALASRAGAK
jgi:hypothetical protein